MSVTEKTFPPSKQPASKVRIAVKPGPLTLFYPKWIPGEHSPTGPINNMVGLKLSAGGKPIAWRRDDVEMFAFHCEIPQGVTFLDVTFDDVFQPAGFEGTFTNHASSANSVTTTANR